MKALHPLRPGASDAWADQLFIRPRLQLSNVSKKRDEFDFPQAIATSSSAENHEQST